MPEDWMESLARRGARDFVMVAEKRLLVPDVAKNNNRLSLPESTLEMLPMGFLTEEELDRVENRESKGLTVTTVDKQGIKDGDVRLKRWTINQVHYFNLLTDWYKLVLKKGLKPGDTVEVWAFRRAGELFLTVIKVDQDS